MIRGLWMLLATLLVWPLAAGAAEDSTGSAPPKVHALAMHGTPKYGPDFRHFDYVNPDAPKGGTLKRAALGGFDNLNPFLLKGTPAAGAGLPFETLLTASADEPFTQYGLLAESLQVPADRAWVIFHLRPEARFHDGTPVTAEDVVFSFNTLREKGHPLYRFYYENVADVAALADRTVKFTFSGGENRELPLIVGQMPVLPAHYWAEREFTDTTLEPPLGSGPYRIADFEPNRYVVLERVEDWWGQDLPVSVGSYNFDTLRYDYYRDSTVALQAFKAGEYDFRLETEAKKWATGYDTEARRDGVMKTETFPHDRPAGMQAFVFNTRKPLFQDPRVRQALGYAFDFQWTNAKLFYDQYTRTQSYFANSPLAAREPISKAERALLAPYGDQVPPEVFTTVYEAPRTDGDGNIRPQLRKAFALLKEAGWTFKDRKLVHGETGAPFTFEILLNSATATTWERVALPFVRNLERLGITARLRAVDTAQYQNRTDSFDFDMMVDVFPQSESPGNEQRDFWGSEAADSPGSRNTIGIADPVVDGLVAAIIGAADREALVTACRALDRVLLWRHYVIPQWHISHDRIAFWDKYGIPEVIPRSGVQVNTWWQDPDKAARVAQWRDQR